MSWQERVVLVTGGSSGLGRSIAAAFAARGARLVLAARGAEALERAAEELRRAHGVDVLAAPTDITRQEQVDALLASAAARFGRLDVLVNNAGRSARRAVLDTTPDDFQELLELNFLSLVRCTRAAAPHLLERRGHVVNIASLAGKSATRYMGAYPASKFAVSAYSQQLRLELGPQGLHVLLVCPGPIARDQPRTYAAADNAHLPDAARRPGAGIKVKAIDPDWLAGRIVRACDRRAPELIAPWSARFLFALQQLSPRLGDWILRRKTS